jgi:hypothetical protein
MQKISIYTLTMGRWKYLRDLIESIPYDSEIEHFIIYQGVKPTEEISQLVETHGIKTILLEQNIGSTAAMNLILPQLSGDIVIKFDDDAKVISKDFFKHVREINKLNPNLVFSAYPVGLINNPGGVLSRNHSVIYSEDLDQYYTLRFVHHVGGFARISPGFTKSWQFENDLNIGRSGNEDSQHAQKCLSSNVQMAYLENALIVEHNESSLGQHARYGEDYFKGGF